MKNKEKIRVQDKNLCLLVRKTNPQNLPGHKRIYSSKHKRELIFDILRTDNKVARTSTNKQSVKRPLQRLESVETALLCFSAAVVSEAFHPSTAEQNPASERRTVALCLDEMCCGKLPSMHTERKGGRACVGADGPRKEDEAVCNAAWCWLLFLSKQGDADSNEKVMSN